MKLISIITNIVWAMLLMSAHSQSQVNPEAEAPRLKTETAIDLFGVDLISGEAVIPGVEMSIGTDQSGISIADSSFNGMRISYKGEVHFAQSANINGCSMLPAGRYFEVSAGDENAVFQYVEGSTNQTLVRGKGNLRLATGGLTYIALDATEYFFDMYGYSGGFAAIAGSSGCLQRKVVARLSKITKPNGEIVQINYRFQPVTLPTGATTGNIAFIDSVRSSLGWIFKHQLISQTESSAGRTSKKMSVLVNLSTEYCGAGTSASCASISTIWPKFELIQTYSSSSTSYSYSGSLTDPEGKTTTLQFAYLGTNASFDTVLTSPTGLVKKYHKWCDPNCVTGTRRVSGYSQGSITVGGYGNRSMEPSNYADHSSVMNEASGPYGKVRYVPKIAEFPFYFIDNLSRTKVNGYQSNAKWLLEETGLLNDTRARATYDSRGNVTSISQMPKVAGATPLVTTLAYPAESTCTALPKTCNKPESITDQKGVTTTYTYHAQSGYVETITKPAVNGIRAQTRFKYEQKTPYAKNSSGVLTASPPVWVLTEVSECMTQSLNACVGTADERKITFSDFTNNLLPQRKSIENGNASIRLEAFTTYDRYGNAISIDGPRAGANDTIYYFYDLMRRKVGEIGIDPDGSGPLRRKALRITYNGDGNIISQRFGFLSGVTKADLDAMLAEQETTIEYSTDHGLPIVERSFADGALQQVTQKSYDSKLRLECVARRLNRNAWNSLPASACTLGVAGSEGNDRITKYTYDATGAVLSIVNGYGTPAQRAEKTNAYYPENGLLMSEKDGRGNTTFYKYDDFGRLFKTAYPLPSSGATESPTDYTQTNFKAGSSLVNSVRLRDGLVISFSAYDEMGRIKTKSGALSESFSYNNFGQVTARTNNSTGGSSQTSAYKYNALGWLLSETRSSGQVSFGSVNYGYDQTGRRTSFAWPDGVSIKYDYTVNGVAEEHLKKITESNGTLLAAFEYYDNGRRKSMTRGNGVITSYSYNDQYQLTRLATDVGGANVTDDISESFAYTVAGQIKTRTISALNVNYLFRQGASSVTSYTPDALNRLNKVNGTVLSYDGRGNLTNDLGKIYAYNANNLLLSANIGGVSTILSYDAENRLQSVTKSGATTKFIYDGTDLIAETDANNTILRRYVHGPEVDDPIVWYEGAGTADKRYYTANYQGSIVGVTLQNGMSTSINAYDEYGNQRLTSVGRFQYTGQLWIPEVGMYYYKARFYNPSLGRFMQTDPVGYKDGMNWYAYVGNDPVNKVDPTGTTCEMREKNLICKVDDPGKLKPKQVARIEKAYTKAVKNLLKEPNKVVTVKVKDKSFMATAREQAESLMNAEISIEDDSNAKRRAHAEGGPLRPKSEGEKQRITINTVVLRDIGDDSISRTFIHESLHLHPGEKVMLDLFKSGPKQFNQDHRNVYNNAAYELF